MRRFQEHLTGYYGRLSRLSFIKRGGEIKEPVDRALSARPRRTNSSLLSASTWLPLLRQTLAQEERFRWPLRGASMTPTLPRGCEIEIAPLLARVRLGDVVVFISQDVLVAHRLVHRWHGFWITQGDGRPSPDHRVDPNQVLGVVTAAYLDGRRCWPGRLSRAQALFWVIRYHILRVLRLGASLSWRFRISAVLARVALSVARGAVRDRPQHGWPQRGG